MKIRIKFRKDGSMKYIGHLDIMRYFQMAIRRAGIDIRYSEGFNPHQIMSFAAPLGVGMVSSGEYFDIEVHSTASSAESIRLLNEQMAEGMEVLSYRLLPDDAKKSMALVEAADYRYTFSEDALRPFSLEELEERIKNYFTDRPVIEVVKKTKKSERLVDLKPLIYDMHAETGEGGRPAIFFRLSAGSVENVKPELVLENMYQFYGGTFDPCDFIRRRLEVYTTVDGILTALGDMGAVIDEG